MPRDASHIARWQQRLEQARWPLLALLIAVLLALNSVPKTDLPSTGIDCASGGC